MIASSWTPYGDYGMESARVDEVAGAPQQSVPRAERATHCVVSGAHAFILRISMVVGLAPLRFESHGAGFTVSISRAMCVYSYILGTVLGICTVFGIIGEIKVGTTSIRMQTPMSLVASASDVLIVAVTGVVGVYGAPRRMRIMFKFMEDIATADLSLGSQYSAAIERKQRWYIVATLILFAGLMIDDFVFYMIEAEKADREWDVLYYYISFYSMWFLVIILEIQFVFTALSVSERFAALNNVLALTTRPAFIPEKRKYLLPLNMYAIRASPADSQGFANDRGQVVIIKRTAGGKLQLVVPPNDAVRRLAALHGTLCDVVTSIDASYGLSLIFILISTLLHLIVTPYFAIMEIMVSKKRPHFLILQVMWCVMYFLRMVGVVEPGQKTIDEGKRMEAVISRLLTSAPSGGVLPARLEIFSRQLMLQSAVSYEPLGMCTLNRSLIASTLAAVTIYLVIIIQFQNFRS